MYFVETFSYKTSTGYKTSNNIKQFLLKKSLHNFHKIIAKQLKCKFSPFNLYNVATLCFVKQNLLSEIKNLGGVKVVLRLRRCVRCVIADMYEL